MQLNLITALDTAAVNSPQAHAAKVTATITWHGEKLVNPNCWPFEVALLPPSPAELRRGRSLDSGEWIMIAQGCNVGANRVISKARAASSAADAWHVVRSDHVNSTTIANTKNVFRSPTLSKEIPFISAHIVNGSATHA